MLRNPVHAALSLVLTLFGVAVHFVAMEAHFLAAVQVIVYAGAIVVLFLFVIMLLGVDRADDLRDRAVPDPATAGVRSSGVGTDRASSPPRIARVPRGRLVERLTPLDSSGDSNIRRWPATCSRITCSRSS